MKGMILLAAGLLGGVGAYSGCATDDSGGDPSGGAGKQFGRQYGALACPILTRCCAQTEAPVDYDCEGYSANAYGAFDDALAAGTKVLDTAAAETCLAALRAVVGCPTKMPDCSRVIVNATLLAEGEPCSDELDCAQPAGTSASCEGTVGEDHRCALYLHGSAGDLCGRTCWDAADGLGGCVNRSTGPEEGPNPAECRESEGLFCSAISGTCEAHHAEGESCRHDGECAAGLYCRGAEPDSLCAEPEAFGATCDTESLRSCGPGYCGEDQLCHAALAVGDPCSQEITIRCGEGITCDPRNDVCTDKLSGLWFTCSMIRISAGAY